MLSRPPEMVALALAMQAPSQQGCILLAAAFLLRELVDLLCHVARFQLQSQGCRQPNERQRAAFNPA